ncbi:hypothetical protein M3C63_09665, partial [Brevibacterium luteolum]|uniref:hypothetical protein n=1 Tax=Brevibacterium luteolum TaxID=199591 RepID=UPI00223BEBEF
MADLQLGATAFNCLDDNDRILCDQSGQKRIRMYDIDSSAGHCFGREVLEVERHDEISLCAHGCG